MASAYRHDGLAACLGQDPSISCAQALHSFTSQFERTGNLVAWFTLLPGLIGVPARGAVRPRAREAAPTGSPGRRASPAAAGSPPSSASRSAQRWLVALVLTLLMTWWRTRSCTCRDAWTERLRLRRLRRVRSTRSSRSASQPSSASSGAGPCPHSSSRSPVTLAVRLFVDVWLASAPRLAAHRDVERPA